MTKRIETTEKERFIQLTGNADAWESIDNLVALCDDDGFWSEDFLSTATVQAKKSHVRRLIKSIPGDGDLPAWASIETTNEEGKTVRVYKQETLFDISDYEQVVTYHSERATYHRRLARRYAKRAKARFNAQMELGLNEQS